MLRLTTIALLMTIAGPALARDNCTRLKRADTLVIHGTRQHAERFAECIAGHWPNVDEVYRKIGR
jgi:hypothetical protein